MESADDPRPAWWVFVVIGGVGLVALAALFWSVPALVPAEGTGEQARAARTSGVATLRAAVLAGGLGLAAVLTLLFHARTAHTTEQNLLLARRAQADARAEAERQARDRARDIALREEDARERRVTELYTAAADQLGAEKAPVRLAGLYALERLARTTPEHRRTIVDVWCAYLRMPHTPSDTGDEEREVRLTAQRLLAAHLRPDDTAEYWPEVVELDLTGAVLADLDLSRCALPARTTLAGAVLGGKTWFAEARFTGRARFEGAVFQGPAQFDGADFEGGAAFVDARFDDIAWFADASFGATARFDGAAFDGRARFSRATFLAGARFREARFARARFDTAVFAGDAWFTGAAFAEGADFGEATFSGDVGFRGATSTGDLRFDGARARPGGHRWPAGWLLSHDVDGDGRHRLVPG
ncbi:pentapeptide repeat protein [Actinomycetospora succinea]|uniref:Pentapeptide repeat protein n=1 Tax=Actinomycetospora succinea TaxID=663603 RepID=A0A4V6PX33_9PSEU|nr:pentapeptide repeat-containing protein [Actinomycetospora succinea]TDQ63273.1 pentapeptide repeat protein [Actinomycetospora succinea]